MKLKKPVLLILLCFAIISSCKNKEQAEVETSVKEVVIDIKSEKQLVENVMKAYKDAIQNLTTEGTFELFTPDAIVFEQGKVEGTYKDYIDHHLGPELGHFKSFTFSDYEIDAQVDGNYAFTTETYVYTIILKPNDKGESRTIAKKGVATSILKKMDGKWKIIKTHTSSRNKK